MKFKDIYPQALSLYGNFTLIVIDNNTNYMFKSNNLKDWWNKLDDKKKEQAFGFEVGKINYKERKIELIKG